MDETNDSFIIGPTSGLAYEIQSSDGSDSWCQYRYQGEWQCVPSVVAEAGYNPPTPGYVGYLLVAILVLSMALIAQSRKRRGKKA